MKVRFLLDRNFSLVPLSTKLKQGSYPKRCKTSRVAKPSWNDTDDMSLSLSNLFMKGIIGNILYYKVNKMYKIRKKIKALPISQRQPPGGAWISIHFL